MSTHSPEGIPVPEPTRKRTDPLTRILLSRRRHHVKLESLTTRLVAQRQRTMDARRHRTVSCLRFNLEKRDPLFHLFHLPQRGDAVRRVRNARPVRALPQ